MSLFRYAICVTQDTKSELARSIGAILGRRRDQLALSNRQIALEAGVSHMTVKRAIDADTSVSVDTLAAICYALRLTPWRVLRDAEDSVSDQQPDATASPDTYIADAQAKLEAFQQGNYQLAARHQPNHDPTTT